MKPLKLPLPPNQAVDGLALALPAQPLAAGQAIEGAPQVGTLALGALGGTHVGVWEHAPGASRDVEGDEFFVVIAGRATVRFADGSPDMHLRPGSIARLAAGTATTWTIAETLRKVYIA